LNNESGIVHVSYNYGADIITNVEDVSDRFRDNQGIGNLLLSAHNNTVVSTDGNGGLAKALSCFECVLNLVDATIGREHFHDFVETHCYW
jgi:hypothetical protein